MASRAKNVIARARGAVHRTLFLASGGRVGGHLGGIPVILLITVGRRSGRRRQTMLSVPYTRGRDYVVVASNGGDDHHPAWYLNLSANPRVEVVSKGDRRPMRATVADPDERAVLWPEVVAGHSNYAEYQERTSRQLPLVVLAPIDDPPEGADGSAGVVADQGRSVLPDHDRGRVGVPARETGHHGGVGHA